jgi:hypothetical protein
VTAFARDGAVRFAISAGVRAYDFAIARDRIVMLDRDAAAYEPRAGARPTPLEPFLRWELGASCEPTALALVDGDDRVVWQRAVPARVRALAGDCDDAAVYRRQPRAADGVIHGVMGIERTPAAVVEADYSGILVVRAGDGIVLLDQPAPAGSASVFFDQGTYDLDGTCQGRVRGARLFARCGDEAVYFNGSTAMLLSLASLRVEAQTTLPAGATVRSTGLRTDMTIQLGKHTLLLQGVTHVD